MNAMQYTQTTSPFAIPQVNFSTGFGFPQAQQSAFASPLGFDPMSAKEGAKIEPINWKTFIGGARPPELQG